MEGIMGLKTADASILSLIILIIIYLNSYKRFERAIFSNRLFSDLVVTNIVMIIIDLLAWSFNTLPGETNLELNEAANAAFFIGAPLAPSLWLIYSAYQIYQKRRLLKHTIIILAAGFILNSIASLASVVTGWYFYIDHLNVYHEGSFVYINIIYSYALIIFSFFLIVINRKKIEKRNVCPMLLFFVPTAIGVLIQAFYYAPAVSWISMAVSVFIVYLFMQNRGLNTDHLTGAFNRRQFETYINSKEKTGVKPFSAIVMDFDGLKRINDSFGHAAGDEALIDMVSIIKRCIRRNDFVARMGGDEFVVIIDTDSSEALEIANKRIARSIEDYNASSGRPYKISFSSGWGTYRLETKEKPREFIKNLDGMMYMSKAQKKPNKEALIPYSLNN